MRILIAASLLVLTTGCRNSLLNRSLVFFTNTTVGVDVGFDPATGNSAKLSVGYKRQEGVLNPVYASNGSRSTPTAHYNDEAYSVLAKIVGNASGNANGQQGASISGAQWFATGQAAKSLATQPGIAAAVTGSSAVGEAAVEEAKAQAVRRLATSPEAIFSIYEGLKRLAATDPEAARHQQNLDSLGARVPASMTRYQAGGANVDVRERTVSRGGPPYDFYMFSTYHSNLRGSYRTLKAALASPPFEYQPSGANAAASVAAGSTEFKALAGVRDSYKAAANNLMGIVLQDDRAMDALRYYVDAITR